MNTKQELATQKELHKKEKRLKALFHGKLTKANQPQSKGFMFYESDRKEGFMFYESDRKD